MFKYEYQVSSGYEHIGLLTDDSIPYFFGDNSLPLLQLL
jgi:hypothetical protein